MISWIKSIIAKIKQELAYRKRLKELKKKLSDYYKKELDEGIEGLSKIKTRYNR